MNNVVHATFTNAQDGIGAVESLLHHGVCAEDINLILPETEYPGQSTVHTYQEVGRTAANPSSAPDVPLPAARRRAAERSADALLPQPPQLTALFPHAVRPHETEFAPADHVSGYRYDALGAVLRDPEPKQTPADSIGSCHEAVVDTEQGAGLGLAFGLLTAMCVPGITLIADAGTIAGLIAAGAVAGGLAGGIYGYLIDRGIDHQVAHKVSEHLAGGGTTLTVTVSGALKEAEIVHLLHGFGGHLIPPSGQE